MQGLCQDHTHTRESLVAVSQYSQSLSVLAIVVSANRALLLLAFFAVAGNSHKYHNQHVPKKKLNYSHQNIYSHTKTHGIRLSPIESN